MRHTKYIHLLLALVLAAPVAFAQTRDRQAADSAPAEDAIAAARSQYTPAAAISTDASDAKMLAQLAQRRPRPSLPPRHGYPAGGYQTPRMDHGSPGHILIGAAIGFGVGAALGAHQSARNGTPVSGGILIGGGIFGFLGGCVGQAVSTFPGVHYSSAHRKSRSRATWPEDDEESDFRSHSNATEGHPETSGKTALTGQPAAVEAMAAASPGQDHD